MKTKVFSRVVTLPLPCLVLGLTTCVGTAAPSDAGNRLLDAGVTSGEGEGESAGEGEGEGSRQCLQSFTLNPPESKAVADGPPPTTVTLTQAWTRSALCEGTGVGLDGDDVETTIGDAIIVTAKVRGESRRIVAALHHAVGERAVAS